MRLLDKILKSFYENFQDRHCRFLIYNWKSDISGVKRVREQNKEPKVYDYIVDVRIFFLSDKVVATYKENKDHKWQWGIYASTESIEIVKPIPLNQISGNHFRAGAFVDPAKVISVIGMRGPWNKMLRLAVKEIKQGIRAKQQRINLEEEARINHLRKIVSEEAMVRGLSRICEEEISERSLSRLAGEKDQAIAVNG
ncbi:MAG: hypothetical protein UT24_C0030G0003 [Candidatus Woesebacteria bacterium GW2011_GWB1_39_12]|uniref:Uncharacterized protein n=1 Tax=Candidatus Woesebacteria bacterium GW2011_GWB1_39_12 TaxID=1618574 RepID=A0A0G0MEZ9_9BACT|nr:MAG: hypothetical protein UT24_C0030G0003 [Candidatus Woesebacteria bacterium GW2011_GWB1_39_12]